MRKTHTNNKISKRSKHMISGLMVAALVAPGAMYAAPRDNNGNNGDRGNGHGYAFGHIVAPGWISNFGDGDFTLNFNWLPAGIAKKIDLIDPSISDIDVADLATSSAVISVSADEMVSATLYVSETSDFDLEDAPYMITNDEYQNEHTFELSDLEADTTYYYRVVVTDAAGNSETTEEMEFTTTMTEDDTDDEDDEDTTGPVISDVNIDTTDTTITVSGMTDELADSALYLSTVEPVDRDAEDTLVELGATSSLNHTITAGELSADTTYYGVLVAIDEADNETVSDTFTVTTNETPDTEGPVVSNVTLEATDSSITLTGETDEAATSTLYLSTTEPVDLEAAETLVIDGIVASTSHTITAEELEAETTYYGVVVAVDAAGNETITDTFSIMTEAIDTEAPVISNVSGEATTTSITGSWTTNEPATSAIYTSTTSGFALDDTGVVVTEDTELTTEHELTITDLEAATTYYHRIVTEDAAGNETVSGEFTFGTI